MPTLTLVHVHPTPCLCAGTGALAPVYSIVATVRSKLPPSLLLPSHEGIRSVPDAPCPPFPSAIATAAAGLAPYTVGATGQTITETIDDTLNSSETIPPEKHLQERG